MVNRNEKPPNGNHMFAYSKHLKQNLLADRELSFAAGRLFNGVEFFCVSAALRKTNLYETWEESTKI